MAPDFKFLVSILSLTTSLVRSFDYDDPISLTDGEQKVSSREWGEGDDHHSFSD